MKHSMTRRGAHPLTPIEDQLQPGAPHEALQSLYDAINGNKRYLERFRSQARDPSAHRLAGQLHEACASAERLIVDIWLRHNPE